MKKTAATASASAAAPAADNFFINAAIKNDNDFQIQLANMAYADSLHDFGHAGFSFSNDIKSIYDKGLPVAPQSKWDEDKTLNSVLQNLELKEVNEDSPIPFSVGYNNKPIFNYFAKSYQIREDDIDFGKNFVEKMELGGEGRSAAFVIDFNQHGFLEKLKLGKSAEGFEIFYLMTPEVVNDPAGKSNVTSDILFGATNSTAGVKLISYLDSSTEYINYLSFKPENEHTNLFFSKYDFRLSPIQTVITKQKAEKLITSLCISQPDIPNLVANIQDSKGENSIKTIIGYLKKLVQSLFVSDKTKKLTSAFNFNTKIQQKRGGDWFQALSCLDARNRVYDEILPNKGKNRKLPSTCPVYFVTHDRIAVAYALLIGANVIYIDFYKKVFVFKNNSDPTVKPSGKPLHEIVLENMRNKWTKDALDELIATGNTYIKISIFLISRQFEKYKKIVSMFNSLFQKEPPPQLKIKSYQENVKNGLINAFELTVRFAFYKTTLIDITQEMEIIKKYTPAFDLRDPDEIMKLNKALNTVNAIQEKFGKMQGTAASMQSGIEWWITSNITRLDIYKTATQILENISSDGVSYDTAAADLNTRLMLIEDNTRESNRQRMQDKHVFLSFLKKSLSDEELNPFKQVILLLTEQTKEYFKLLSPSKAVHELRGGRIAPNLLFYNEVANLIYEANVFIGVAETLTKDDILIDYCRDEVLIHEDMYDITLFNTDGKHSNDTAYATDLTVGGRGDYTIFDGDDRQKPMLINDISVRQMVWPLLTHIMFDELENLNPEEAAPNVEEKIMPPAPPKGGNPVKSLTHLLPIYMIASAIFATHDAAKLANHPDKENYNKYYGFIKALFEKEKHPFANHLYVFFFASNASNLILSELKTYCPIWVLLLNDIFSNAFMGSVKLLPAEEALYAKLVSSVEFKQFIQSSLFNSGASIEQLYNTMRNLLLRKNTKIYVKKMSSRARRSSKKSKSKKITGNKQTRRVFVV